MVPQKIRWQQENKVFKCVTQPDRIGVPLIKYKAIIDSHIFACSMHLKRTYNK